MDVRQGQAGHPRRDAVEVRARGRLPGPDGRHVRPERQAAASSPATDHPRSRKEPAHELSRYTTSATRSRSSCPEWPSTPSVNVDVNKFHAKDGVYQVEWEGIMHRCTHMDAPLHVTENTPTIGDYPLWRLFGTGVCVVDPQGQVGRHHARGPRERDAQDRRGRHRHDQHRLPPPVGRHRRVLRLRLRHLPAKAPSGWWTRRSRWSGYGCQANDHPIATKLVDHGLGPTHPHLIEEYKAETGRDPKEDFPELGAGAQDPHGQGRHPRHRERRRRPRRGHRQALHLHGLPWRWPGGDGCIVRVLAIIDPDQTFRFETGE